MPAALISRRLLGLLVGAAALLAPVAVARAATFAPLVPRGGIALPAGARDLGRLAPQTELRVTVALRPRHQAALAAYAAAVSRPGTRQFDDVPPVFL